MAKIISKNKLREEIKKGKETQSTLQNNKIIDQVKSKYFLSSLKLIHK